MGLASPVRRGCPPWLTPAASEPRAAPPRRPPPPPRLMGGGVDCLARRPAQGARLRRGSGAWEERRRKRGLAGLPRRPRSRALPRRSAQGSSCPSSSSSETSSSTIVAVSSSAPTPMTSSSPATVSATMARAPHPGRPPAVRETDDRFRRTAPPGGTPGPRRTAPPAASRPTRPGGSGRASWPGRRPRGPRYRRRTVRSSSLAVAPVLLARRGPALVPQCNRLDLCRVVHRAPPSRPAAGEFPTIGLIGNTPPPIVRRPAGGFAGCD